LLGHVLHLLSRVLAEEQSLATKIRGDDASAMPAALLATRPASNLNELRSLVKANEGENKKNFPSTADDSSWFNFVLNDAKSIASSVQKMQNNSC